MQGVVKIGFLHTTLMLAYSMPHFYTTIGELGGEVRTHIVQNFLSIHQRIHSKRLRILNTWWSDLCTGVTFTSQFTSILPHPCDDHLRSRFFISRITEPKQNCRSLNEAKRAGEIFFSKFCSFFTGQGGKVSLVKILFPQLREACFKATKIWSVYTSTTK